MPYDYTEHEKAIVWLKPVQQLEFVRETVTTTPFRQRRPRDDFEHGRMVGYATLKPSAPSFNTWFYRRVFWIADRDWTTSERETVSGCPIEAIVPCQVKAGQAVLPWLVESGRIDFNELNSGDIVVYRNHDTDIQRIEAVIKLAPNGLEPVYRGAVRPIVFTRVGS